LECARCQSQNPAEANFCLECGAALASPCQSCSAAVPSGAKFCPDCGAPVAGATGRSSYTPSHLSGKILASRGTLEGERKQVTVLFCDIVHSSSLAQPGPEAMHALLDRFFTHAADEVHRYEGTINQFLGDGFMALFGAPISHEDHARRAVLCALGLREAVAGDESLADVDLRMGINGGDVVVGAIGDDLRMDYTAFGDTTILAARLEAAAQPGEILVSEETARAVQGYVEVEEVGAVEVKERTVRPLRVLREGVRKSRLEGADRRLSPFVGRARELELLEGLRAEANGGLVVGIVGEPGIGKSRLTHEFRVAVGESAVVHVGRCFSFGAATPYLPILDLLRDTCGIGTSDDREESVSKLREGLTEAGIEAEAALPFLLQLLGDPDATSRLAELDPSTIKGRTFGILRDLWLGLGERGPLVLLIEDLHWLDRTSEDFLAGFTDELPASSVLLLATYRPGYTPPWAGKSYATQVALSPLDADAGRALVHSMTDVPDELADTIVARAEGNPFFLEELANMTLEDGSADAVPQTVTEVLAARLDRLEPKTKRVLQSGSILGREFDLRLLRSLLPEDTLTSEPLDELKRAELLFERRGGDERTFVFKHALTQAVAYESLLESTRSELHGRAGRALEETAADRLDVRYELLAHHYSRSDNREKAFEYLVLANRKAAARNAMEEALGYFYGGLAVLDELPDTRENRVRRVELVLEQTAEFHFLHRHREYMERLVEIEPLVRGLDDDFLLGGYLSRMGHREAVLAENPRADETLRHAATLCERTGNYDGASCAYTYLGWTHHQLGDYPLAHEYFAKARAKLEEHHHPIWYQYTRGGAIVAYALAGRWDDAARDADDAVAVARARSETATVSFSYSMGAFAFVQQRNWERAVEYSQLALADAPTIYLQGFPQIYLGAAACATGRIDEGLPVLELIIRLIEQSGHVFAWASHGPMLGQAYITAGRNDDARALLEPILDCTDRGRALCNFAQVSRLLGEIAAVEGDPAAAARFERAIEAAEVSGSENELALALADRGRLRGPDGAPDLERALAIFERLGTCVEPERIRAELAAAVT
jgi:predicted ATPase/class 3 adenylate cyclase